MIHPRPVLCPDRVHSELDLWTPSENNFWWRPKIDIYPSTSEFLPGDILLFRPLKPSPLQLQIMIHQQNRGHAVEHATFTHAAIWVGLDHLICDATPKFNVRVNSLEDYLKKRSTCLLVRRVPNISADRQEAVVRAAVNYRGEPYSFRTLVLEKWGHFIGREPYYGLGEKTRRGLICSTLCARAVAIGTETVSLLPSDMGLVTPATISVSPKLEDVEIQWCKVQHSV